jgi:hypothetical protein
MGLTIFGYKKVECDGVTKGIKCHASICRSNVRETLEAFIELILKRGWIKNEKTGKWFCPRCANIKQKGIGK